MAPNPPIDVERLLTASTNADLAAFLKVHSSHLTRLAYRLPDSELYREFQVPKKRGGRREIAAPQPALAYLQRQLASAFLELYTSRQRDNVHGFVRGRNVATNAARHRRKRWVLNIDLEDFFPSINFGRVRGLFLAKPYELAPTVATTLARLCCRNNELPQGAPTSPIITNMLCAKLDRELISLARKNKATVTRYADDITFSTDRKDFPVTLATLEGPEARIALTLERLLVSNGFKPNPAKTRLQGRHRRQEVTGLTVNRVVNVRRGYLKQIRAMLHSWAKNGYDEAQKKHLVLRQRESGSIALNRVIAGKLSYIKLVRGVQYPPYLRLKDQFDNLNGSSLESAVWIVETDGLWQGTGFFLKDVGFVTCHHVVEEGKSVIFQHSKSDLRFELKRIISDKDADIAICETVQQLPTHRVRASERQPEVLQPVRLIGYPDWSAPATVSIQNGYISQLRTHFGFPAALVTTQIIGGASGAPLFSADGKVVGVATRQTANSAQDHCSAIVLISAVKAMAMKATVSSVPNI